MLRNLNPRGFWKVLLLAVGLFSLAVSHADSRESNTDHRGTIVGQALDSLGVPLEGVTVSVQDGPTATSNAGGMFTLMPIKQKSRVIVTFRKAGYLSTQGAVSFRTRSDKGSDHHSGDKKSKNDDRDDDDDSNHSKKVTQATLVRTMLKLGAAQTINNASGGVAKEAGTKVTFPVNSLNTNGDVQVTVTPIDVSTSAIFAAPGDFLARTSAGQQALLETFTMADVSLSQNGQPVNLAPGTLARLELLLPAATRLQVGDTQPMWYFSEQRGLWIEEGVGTVGPSTEVPGRLAAFADVAHFTPWNLDVPFPPTQITYVGGRVVSATGQPLAGAYVSASFAGVFLGVFRATTDSNGFYCVPVRIGALVSVNAQYSQSGLVVSAANPVQVQASSTPSTGCSAATAPVLVIDTAPACVSGDVLDAAGAPVAGATVYSSSGGFGATNAVGFYQLPAPANSPVVVYSAGYPAVSVTTGATGSACANAPLRITTGSNIACVSSFIYQCNTGNRYPNVTVIASDLGGTTLGLSLPSNANGEYCIDGLPANTGLRLQPTPNGSGGVLANSGVGGGSCATNSCNVVPAMDIFCF